jgi:parallel beta-helix repeat protein
MGDDAALFLQDAEDCRVEGCHFLRPGAYGIALRRGAKNLLRGCEVVHAGGGGVLLQDSRENQVEHNHLHHLGEAYRHIGGVVLVGAGASGNRIANNAIHDSSRYGISLKNAGGGNRIEANRIERTCLETADAGGIEVTQQDRSQRAGSLIQGNLVSDPVGYSSSWGRPSYLSWGIYLDSFASGYEVRGNLVLGGSNGGVMIQGGQDNRVVQNVFAEGQTSLATLANFQGQSRGNLVSQNAFLGSRRTVMAFETGRLEPGVVRLERNLYMLPGGPGKAFSSGAPNWEAWLALGLDQGSRLQAGSLSRAEVTAFARNPGPEAARLGISPLSVDKAGPWGRPCGCPPVPLDDGRASGDSAQ